MCQYLPGYMASINACMSYRYIIYDYPYSLTSCECEHWGLSQSSSNMEAVVKWEQ